MSIETIGPFTRPAVIARGAESIRSELVTLRPYIGLDVAAVVNGSAAANVHRQSVAVASRGVRRTPDTPYQAAFLATEGATARRWLGKELW
jgi:hypothetical protein